MKHIAERLLVFTALLAFAMFLAWPHPAHAWDCGYWQQTSDASAECYRPPAVSAPSTSAANAASDAAAAAVSAASATQKQNQVQQQAQTQAAVASAGSNAVNEGNSLSTSYVNNAVRNAPAAFAGGTNTTAQCRYSVGAGGSAVVGGLSFGIGRKDKDCERLGLAMYLRDIGQVAASEKVLCAITRLKEALGETCLALVHEVVPVARAAGDGSSYVSREELDRLIKKGLVK